MPILKSITTPNQATVAFHKPVSATINFERQEATVYVGSWASEAAHNQGSSLAWNWPVALPIAALADVETALLAVDLFAGGAVVADATVTLDGARVRAWLGLKKARDDAEFGGFDWDGSRFDSDAVSQSRIQGSAQLATLAVLADQPFSVPWTLADNSVRTLDRSDMLAVGQAMGVHIMDVHAHGRHLRDEVVAAPDASAVTEIIWAST